MDRKQKILHPVNLAGSGLELGPLCWPLLKKDEADVYYADHVDRDGLLKIYKDDAGVLPELIPDVDYPLNGRSLAKAIPKKKFDYLIASHVIEHVPDMVRWFQDISAILKPGGVATLAVPDKRFTFDIDRQTSELSDVMGSYVDNTNRASSTMIFDYASHFRTKLLAEEVWKGELYLNTKTAPHRYSLEEALKISKNSKKEYVDAHCYVFTPYSFFEVIRGLIELGLFDFKVISFYTTAPDQYEFLVAFQKVNNSISKTARLKSLPDIDRDPYPREQAATITNLMDDIKSLRAGLEAFQVEINHMKRSKSWKATRPLRGALRVGKRIRHKS